MSISLYTRILGNIEFDQDDRILAVCAGSADREALLNAGARNVVISNLDHHAGVTDYTPFDWSYQDAENINAKDRSYDWCIVQAGLHHCASPHHAMCEMLRVSRKGIIVIESRDSALMRLATAFGLTSDFECEPALLSNGKSGGYRNTHIPNHIYRWTEREVEKTARSMLPHIKLDFRYFYRFAIPLQRMAMSRSIMKRVAAKIGSMAVPALEFFFPRQSNQFGFVVLIDRPLQPWLSKAGDELVVNLDYLAAKYDRSKYNS